MALTTRLADRQDERASCLARYRKVRALTEALAAPLSPEDQTLQSMPDASPTKWHRAHTTWFFETFILAPHADRLRVCRSRPTAICSIPITRRSARAIRGRRAACCRARRVAEIAAYRAHVDEAMERFLAGASRRRGRWPRRSSSSASITRSSIRS